MKDFQLIAAGNFKFKSEVPGRCPYCQKETDIKKRRGFISVIGGIYYAFVPLICSSCGNVFFAKYALFPSTSLEKIHFTGIHELPGYYAMVEVMGGDGKRESFSEVISKLSPRFVSIFHQADSALQKGWNDVAGIGFRLSYEILVKDLLISLGKEKIPQKNLSKCISELGPDIFDREFFLDTSRLGNDFAHYVSKHPEMTIHELRDAIMSCIEKIDRYLKDQKFKDSMRPKKSN